MIHNHYIQFAVLLLGISRLVIIAVRDDISKPVRRIVFKYSKPENSYKSSPYPSVLPLIDKKAGWWGRVFDCPDCMGPYVATLAVAAFYFHPIITSWTLLPFAASMITSLIARRY